MIHNFRKPYPDELLYSYLQDLAKLNALSYEEFLEEFIFQSSSGSNIYKKRHDSLYPLSPILKAMDPYKATTTFLETSIYQIVSPFISEAERAVFIGKTFSDFTKYKGIWPSSKTLYFTNLKLCPQCMKEDETRYGHWYYHRSHQAEGLSLCPIHKTPLIKIKDTDKISLAKTLESESKKLINHSLDITPSNWLSNENLSFQKSYGELIYLLSTLDKDLKDKWLIKLKKDKNINQLLLKVRDTLLKAQAKKYRNRSVEDIKDRIAYFLTYSCYPSEGVIEDDDADYEIEKSLGDDVYLCKCKRCGDYFISTKTLLDISYTCPCTRKGKSREVILKEIFDHSFSHRFEWLYLHGPKEAYYLYLYDKLYSKTLLIRPYSLFLNEFSGVKNMPYEIKENRGNIDLDKLGYRISFDSDNKYTFYCKKCGISTAFTTAEKYIGDCPNCERLKLIKESKKIVKKFSDELEVIKDDIKATCIKIKHKACGGVTIKELSVLKKTDVITCSKCSQIFHRGPYVDKNIERLKGKIKIVLGAYKGEIELIEDEVVNSMKVPLLHKACGGVFYRELHNLRVNKSTYCPICKKKIEKERIDPTN